MDVYAKLMRASSLSIYHFENIVLNRSNANPYMGSSWSWSHGSWIYNYLWNQYQSPLTLWARTPLKRGAIDTTLCNKICQWLVTGRLYSPGTPVSSTNIPARHDIAEQLLKVALDNIHYKPGQSLKFQPKTFLVIRLLISHIVPRYVEELHFAHGSLHTQSNVRMNIVCK